MARNATLGTLVRRCQQRSMRDVTSGDQQIDPTEWKALVSEYYAEMHALIVEKGARYFESEATITANGAATYPLPADHLSTIGVDAFLDGSSTGRRRPVYGPVPVQHRTRLMGRTGEAFFYDLEGNSLALYPVPASGTYRHLYVPQPVDLSTAADNTVVDVINIYGERLVIWGVASVAMHKGSESQDRALGEYTAARGQLEYWATLRALNQPSYRVQEDDLEWYPGCEADWRYSR